MTSKSLFTKLLPLAAVAATAGALAGCSTVKSLTPFTSSVPYSQDVQPTIAKPAIAEIPAFKPKPKAEVSVTETPAAPAEAAPAPAPQAAPAPPPAPAAAPPPAPAAAPPPAVPQPQSQSQSSAAPDATAKTAEADVPKNARPSESSEDAEVAGAGEKKPQPTIPDADRQFKDDGSYPNLAQVPPRPVNMPTFSEAKALEKALVADSEKAKDKSQASPDAPALDSAPVPVAKLAQATSQAAPVIAAAAGRPEDSSPCLNGSAGQGRPTATIHFEPGSAALTSATLANLVEALPSIRAATGTIRIFGHGDPQADSSAGSGRFDLAAARAGAVAQAVAGYGIPAPRIAVGVACSDAALGGSSVQLYAES
jgi:outer membrane protein OmpA-like peptidoglycan-associated protein